MKNFRFAIFALSLLLVVSAARAQTTNVAARIPFDFVVGSQVLPAGDYTLRSTGMTGGVLVIHNSDGTATQTTLTNSNEKLNPAEKTVLVFHRLGGQYFLSEVWVAGYSRGRQIPRSSIETRMAMNHNEGEVVIVAALITH